jgi:hypothetical protein
MDLLLFSRCGSVGLDANCGPGIKPKTVYDIYRNGSFVSIQPPDQTTISLSLPAFRWCSGGWMVFLLKQFNKLFKAICIKYFSFKKFNLSVTSKLYYNIMSNLILHALWSSCYFYIYKEKILVN